METIFKKKKKKNNVRDIALPSVLGTNKMRLLKFLWEFKTLTQRKHNRKIPTATMVEDKVAILYSCANASRVSRWREC